MATPRLGLVVEDKPTELSCSYLPRRVFLPNKTSDKSTETKATCSDCLTFIQVKGLIAQKAVLHINFINREAIKAGSSSSRKVKLHTDRGLWLCYFLVKLYYSYS